MFTGIIESMGVLKKNDKHVLYIQSSFCSELEIGQSIAHDGVCLTVTNVFDDSYTVELIPETFKKSHFQNIKEGDFINLERCMKAESRFDGHIVQGHSDFVATIISIKQQENSHIFKISIPQEYSQYFVEKGSVTINGVSLTIIQAEKDFFSVGIIPHTYENTNMKNRLAGDFVNIETDIIGKYAIKLLARR